MKKLIMKLLGLESLVTDIAYLKETLDNVEAKNTELEKSLAELTEKVEAVEDFDADDFVREDDVNDRIESYLNDNDYITQSYCDDEIETKVSDAVESAIDDADIDSKIESAIEDLDIDEKVRELLGDATPAKMCEDAVRKQVIEAVKVTLEKMVKSLADQQD